MALAEGSANDWLPLLMIDGHNFGHTSGTLVYVGFTAGMTLGRFAGGYFVDRFGKVNMLRFSAASAALGLTLVIFSNAPLLAAAAVIFWGIGASLGFPLTISAAGSGENSAVRVTIAATLGYFAFLVGRLHWASLARSQGYASPCCRCLLWWFWPLSARLPPVNVRPKWHLKPHPDVSARFRFVLPEPRNLCHSIDYVDNK